MRVVVRKEQPAWLVKVQGQRFQVAISSDPHRRHHLSCCPSCRGARQNGEDSNDSSSISIISTGHQLGAGHEDEQAAWEAAEHFQIWNITIRRPMTLSPPLPLFDARETPR